VRREADEEDEIGFFVPKIVVLEGSEGD